MPFSGGTFTGVSGSNSAVAGAIIQSAVWNNMGNDYATAFTMVMSQLLSETTCRNALFANGSFEVWNRQQGATTNLIVGQATTLYTADRWYITTATASASITAVTGLTTGSGLALKINRTSGGTGINAINFGYPLDSSGSPSYEDEVNRLAGYKVTLSFTAKAGANWSPTTGTLSYLVTSGTGNPNKLVNFAGNVTVITGSVNLTPGGAATAVSAASSVIVPTNAKQLEVTFQWSPTGTAGADDSVTIDDVQLEPNLSASTWTPTNYDRIPFPVSLDACKRHYQKTFNYNTLAAANGGIAGALGTAAVATQIASVFWGFEKAMRKTPTVTSYIPLTGSSANFYDFTASTSVFANVDVNLGQDGVLIYSTVSGSTTNDLLYIHAAADAGI